MSELTDEKVIAVTTLLDVDVEAEIVSEINVAVSIPLDIDVKAEEAQ